MRAAGLALLAALLVAAPAAADVSGPDIVSFLNAQRAANGLPAGIVEDPALSDGCRKHNAFGARTGSLQHFEDPGAPGFTPEGDAAARAAVLYRGGDPWSARNNPFETAPIHLAQTLAPRLDRMGASEDGGFGCATTLASRNRPAPAANVTYTYPGSGRDGWPVSQRAAEAPYTPGERVGIAAGTTTGPYLYAFFDGPALTPGSVATGATGTLSGPEGAVPVAVVDNTTPGLEDYLPTGALLIPRAPLKPLSRYEATVAATVDGQPFTHTWRFTTAGRGRPFTVKARRRGRTIVLRITSTVPLSGRFTIGDRRRPFLYEPGTRRFAIRVPKGVKRTAKVRLVINAEGRTYRLRR